MKIGQNIGRFRVESVDNLSEYQSQGILFIEELSSARIYHVQNNDKENLFGFCFGTLPTSSNGVAHILEHTVLCGSERYPVKDPFFMLYKGSMQTFLNAMTFPDKTIYPAASTVKQDLFNLMTVYSDAVFFPLLREEHFRQEGHRLGLNDKGDAEIGGIVYNEMKAHYSTQDAIEGEWCYRSLLPDSPYGHDSGGDPAEIPSLSYEEFRAFHQTYYHPSNCLIFLYGDIDSEEYLRFLDEKVFSRFSTEELSRRVNFTVPLQTAWKMPRTLEKGYPVNDKSNKDSSVNLNWLLPEPKNNADIIAMEVLSDILLSSPASPIQKLIFESNLGEDMSSSSGLESDLRQPVFTIGMRGCNQKSSEDIKNLIISGLKKVVEEGIDKDLMEATIRRFEFHSRELKGAPPFGLRLLFRGLKRWLHGEAPATALNFASHIKTLKQKLEHQPAFFRDFIRDHLLNNNHRSLVIVYPDPQQNLREKEAEEARIEKKLNILGSTARETLLKNSSDFDRFQKQVDSPENITKVPFLEVKDIPRNITTIPHRTEMLGNCPMHVHEIFTNGVSYIDLAFDISHLDKEFQLFIPFLFYVLPQIGTKGKSYSHMATEWGLKTGGFSIGQDRLMDITGGCRLFAIVRLKTLNNMSVEGIDLLGQILQEADFSNERYIWELFNEYRNHLRSSIIPNGTGYASIRAGRAVTPQAYMDDLWQGVVQVGFIEKLRSQESTQKTMQDGTVSRERISSFLAETLSTLMAMTFDPTRLSFNITCDEQQFKTLAGQLKDMPTILAQHPMQGRIKKEDIYTSLPDLTDILSEEQPLIEGIGYSTKVNFTAMVLKASRINEKKQVHEHVLSHILRSTVLHEKIRMEGGAYGALCNADPLDGSFNFGSYRDPAISQTWAAYSASLEDFAVGLIDQRNLDLAKIALAGRELRPLSPSEKGIISFKRFCCGIENELRSHRRTWLIETEPADLQRAAQRLCDSTAYRTVLADPETLKLLKNEHSELKQVFL